MSSIAAAAIAAFTLLQPPSRLSLFTYSRDSAAGFKDEALDAFRRELGKQVESFTEVAYSRDEAQVSVQFLGQGDLTLELADGGDSVRYLWRFDEAAPRTWALVRVGEFVKEFSIDGRGARDLSRLAKAIADWIRDNSAAIRAFRARSRGSSHGDASLCPQVPAGGPVGPGVFRANFSNQTNSVSVRPRGLVCIVHLYLSTSVCREVHVFPPRMTFL